MVAEWSFGDVLWAMVAFFFWFTFIWMFIAIFTDIFHRRDLSGGAKAGWIFLVCVLPLLGILIYMISRKETPQDREEMTKMVEAQRRVAGFSAADEIAKLDSLKSQGSINQAEYDQLKERALA